MVGRTIAHYQILEKLGEGGMGIVYKAEDTKLRRLVALKFLPPQLAGSAEFRERFLAEARAAAALSHPNICTIHEIHDEGENAFLELEYVEGQTLSDHIKEGPLKPGDCVAIAIQVADALEEAHLSGVVHRDIKRPSQGDGLRSSARQGRYAAHQAGDATGHGGLHVSRAGPGRTSGRTGRHLVAGGGPL